MFFFSSHLGNSCCVAPFIFTHLCLSFFFLPMASPTVPENKIVFADNESIKKRELIVLLATTMRKRARAVLHGGGCLCFFSLSLAVNKLPSCCHTKERQIQIASKASLSDCPGVPVITEELLYRHSCDSRICVRENMISQSTDLWIIPWTILSRNRIKIIRRRADKLEFIMGEESSNEECFLVTN